MEVNSGEVHVGSGFHWLPSNETPEHALKIEGTQLSEVNSTNRKTSLEQRNRKAQKKNPLPSLKKILMGKWHINQNRPRLREIFTEPLLMLYCTHLQRKK